jgi:hypothetical protein
MNADRHDIPPVYISTVSRHDLPPLYPGLPNTPVDSCDPQQPPPYCDACRDPSPPYSAVAAQPAHIRGIAVRVSTNGNNNFPAVGLQYAPRPTQPESAVSSARGTHRRAPETVQPNFENSPTSDTLMLQSQGEDCDKYSMFHSCRSLLWVTVLLCSFPFCMILLILAGRWTNVLNRFECAIYKYIICCTVLALLRYESSFSFRRVHVMPKEADGVFFYWIAVSCSIFPTVNLSFARFTPHVKTLMRPS